ncbi:hypothetical protein ACFORG_19820 [Lutimaribacter marinistellae]|uniref:Uncharacterized protein n=1 Tax=Lutimaribacter marinistellae TaxID=1820329 RepID=A0ABV7TK60_9RHOB
MKTGMLLAIIVAAMFIAGGIFMIDFEETDSLRLPHVIVDEGEMTKTKAGITGTQSGDGSLDTSE